MCLRKTVLKGWSQTKIDKRRIRKEAKGFRDLETLAISKIIDRAIDILIIQLQNITNLSMPRCKAQKGQVARWWTKEVQDTVFEGKTAWKEYHRISSQNIWKRVQTIYKWWKTVSQAVQMMYQRLDIAKATTQPKTIQKISRWARLKSFLKLETVAILPLGHTEDDAPMAYTHAEKATLLTERFFLNFNTDLFDIINQSFEGEQGQQRFELYRNIDADKVTQIICQIGVWKVPGNDYLPTEFLKMCDRPLAIIIAKITNANFVYKYFPKCLCNVDVIILVKPSKLQKAKQTLGVYRPIVLLSTIDKVMKIAIYRHLSDAMKEYRLLPEGQMGNRVAKSTELAIRVVIEAIYTAWQCGMVMSLLQFDIKGVFDTVNHI